MMNELENKKSKREISKKKIYVGALLAVVVIMAQLGLIYFMMTNDKSESIDADGRDVMVTKEMIRLEREWRETEVYDLIRVEIMADGKLLEEARERMLKAEKVVRKFEKRVSGTGQSHLNKVNFLHFYILMAPRRGLFFELRDNFFLLTYLGRKNGESLTHGTFSKYYRSQIKSYKKA